MRSANLSWAPEVGVACYAGELGVLVVLGCSLDGCARGKNMCYRIWCERWPRRSTRISNIRALAKP